MGDLKARLKPLFRRSSTFSSPKSPKAPKNSVFEAPTGEAPADDRSWSKTSLRLKKKKPSFAKPVYEEKEALLQLHPLTAIETESLGRGSQSNRRIQALKRYDHLHRRHWRRRILR